MSFRIAGTGYAVPEYRLTNEQLTHMVDTSDEWITSRCGIKSRRICMQEKLSDIAVEAAKQALSWAKTESGALDLILCATMQGDYVTPSLACVIQKEIGAACPAFDINAACTGFLYALDVAAGYFARKRARKILVVAAECMSKHVDWTDRTTCVLFGDGAGAVVLEAGDNLLASKLSANGNDEFLTIPGTPGAFPLANRPQSKQVVHMNGQEVYRFAVQAMCQDVEAVLCEAGITIADVRYLLAHQANLRILEAAKARLKLDGEKLVIAVDRYGNTSSASIPIMLDELNRTRKLQPGDLLLLCAFGGGLTTGASIIRW